MAQAAKSGEIPSQEKLSQTVTMSESSIGWRSSSSAIPSSSLELITMTQDKTFAAQVRQDMADDTELRQSLKTFGWHCEFPAIADEAGAILVGNRRLRIAQEEGIAPVIKTIAFGPGSEADAERIKIALISNLG